MHRLERHRIDGRPAGRDPRDGVPVIADALLAAFASTFSEGISRI